MLFPERPNDMNFGKALLMELRIAHTETNSNGSDMTLKKRNMSDLQSRFSKYSFKVKMTENNKNRKTLIIAAILCAIGLILLFSHKFIQSEMDLFSIGLVFNGIGIMLLLSTNRPNPN